MPHKENELRGRGAAIQNAKGATWDHKREGEAISFDDEDKKFLHEWLFFMSELRREQRKLEVFVFHLIAL